MSKLIEWLNQLTIGQKLARVVVAFMLLLTVAGYLLLDEKRYKIDFARAELAGTAYLVPCGLFERHVAQHRVLVARLLVEDSPANRRSLTEVESMVAADLRQLESVDLRLRSDLETDTAGLAAKRRESAHPSRIRRSWEALRASRGESALAMHDSLIAAIRSLITHVGDSSKLILDPALDTYYVMDALLLREPDIIEISARLASSLQGILKRQTITTAERSAIAADAALLRDRLAALESDVQTAIDETPNFSQHDGLAAALSGPMSDAAAKTRSLLDIVDAATAGDVPTGDARELHTAISATLASHGALWNRLFEQEKVLLDIRLGGDLSRRAWAIALITLFLAFTMFLTWMTIRSIVEPLQRASGVALDISRGELPESVDVGTGRDETAQLLRSINEMLRFLDLRKTITTLKDSAVLLESAVGNLKSQSVEQNQAVTRQAAALQETQVTSQEIKQTSRLAAEKAAAVLEIADRAESVSRSGEEALGTTVSGLTEIRRQVDEIAQRITDLNQRAQQIGTITQTVKDLADQSNMLALNAAIEAVRSGEHGKGFAVVAREIRSLADQSIQATNRVNEILENVSDSLRQAVAMAETGRRRMETSVVEVRNSGESLKELSDIVRESSQGVRQIAAAVGQQDAGISQIFLAVNDQSKLMDETVRRQDDTRLAVTTVEDVVSRVSEVVRRFNV